MKAIPANPFVTTIIAFAIGIWPMACSSSSGSPDGGGGQGGGAGSGSGGGAGTGSGGSAGTGSGGAGGAPTLDQACTSVCAAQAALACSVGTQCHDACVAGAAAKVAGGASCQAPYLAMAQCEAGLAAPKWVCSQTDDNPIPVAGQCTNTVCAWACCVQSLIADQDIWSRCMPTCN